MPKKMLLGPLLGLESDTAYTVCFLADKSATAASVTLDGGLTHTAVKVGSTHSGSFWRADLIVAPSETV